MRNLAQWLTVACMPLLALTGCAVDKPMSDEDRANIQAVYFSSDIKKPEKPYYFGPSAAFGMMFGAIGGMATAGQVMDDSTALQVLADQNNIHIEKIVREELIAAVQKRGKPLLADSADAAAGTISIAIKQYGFSIPNGFSSHLVPILFVQCAMFDKSGKVVWKGGEAIRPLGNPVDGVPSDDVKDPAVVERQWRLGAQAIAKDIAGSLAGDKPDDADADENDDK